MNFELSDSERDFRDRATEWLSTVERPAGLRDYGATPTADQIDAGRAWQRLLSDAGFAGPSWPREHGGTGATPVERAIWAEATAAADVPAQVNLVGPELVGPIVIAYGTPEQRALHLPRILSGETVWCQLFSEPEAGSDLAGLRTAAAPDGDGWLVHGQKVWTSGAHYADMGLLLARTEAGSRRHKGITCFLLPMDRPGIDVRPLHQMDGVLKFNEVFLDGVRVGPEDVVGRVGHGWEVAVSTLGHERTMIGANAVRFNGLLDELWEAAEARGADRDRAFRARWAELWARSTQLRLQWYRVLTTAESAGDPRTSLLKLSTTELERDITVLAQDVLGPDLADGSVGERWRARFLAAPGQTIAGGTSEIQRNIIARRVLGLPMAGTS